MKLNNSAEEKVPDITAPFYKLHQRKTKLHIDKCNGFFFIDETQEILLNFELLLILNRLDYSKSRIV